MAHKATIISSAASQAHEAWSQG